ncbi:MAG TPA: hypothetical protein VF131_17810 [Blastocatellia bacterium]|nr:hypothetical protein [Blastocatellia bacterium]
MYWLTKEELEALRAEFQEKEREIQRYIGVYLSGLVLVTGWIIGPQSTPVLKMVLGNSGYNVYAVLVIISLNVLFTCFLIYKSLIVHEITQFMTYQSKPDSGFKYWEKWRRSPMSATKLARPIYTALLAVLPIAVSILLMYGLWKLFHSDSQSLIDQLERIESSASTPVTPTGQLTPPKVHLDAGQLGSVLSIAWIWYWIVAGFHILPALFFYWNWIPNDRRWKKINRLRGPNVSYDDLDEQPTPDEKSDSKVKLYHKGTGQFIGSITQSDLDFLLNHLEEDSETDRDYHITSNTLEALEQAGASHPLMKTLRKALGKQSYADIEWH